MEDYNSPQQIKSLLDRVKYKSRLLTEKEKASLLKGWYDSVACNQQRITQVNDSDVQGFVVGLQFSAVIDGHTCEFCKRHDGEALKIDDPRIKENTPPLHLGCRCFWVPVTKFELEEGFVFKWSEIQKPDFSLVTAP